MKLYLYSVSVVHELKPLDCPQRVEYYQRIFINYACNNGGFDYFFFNDKAWYTLDRYVNSQNQKLCTITLTRVYIQKKIGVCCAGCQKQIVGPIFFEETVNSDVYRFIISQFIVLLELDERYHTLQ